MYDNIEFVICAAGECSRNFPHTKGIPHKALLPMGDKRLIDYPLQDIVRIGGRHITFVCSSQKVIDDFKRALATDTITEEKLRTKGRADIADILRSTFLPDDIDLKFVIQKEPLGTAHVLYEARDAIQDRHAVLIFPDDLVLSHNPQCPHMKKLLDTFLKDPKKVLCTAIWREDVRTNAILQDNRLIEKPLNPTSHTAAMSPNVLPNEIIQFLVKQAPAKIKDARASHKEWFYADVVNDFLDQGGEADGFGIEFYLLDDENQFLDTGNLMLYELCSIQVLLQQSQYAAQNREWAQKLLSIINNHE